MDSNYVRIIDPDKPGDYLVLHTRDLKPTDVLFDEKKHGFAALAARKAVPAPTVKKPDPPKAPESTVPSAPPAPPAKK